jgi:hypothetical protein
MELHLKIIGGIFLLLAIVHITFPQYFNWKIEFKPLSLINSQMIYVHTFFIGLTILLMGLLCLIYSHELVSTELGRVLCLGLFIFWGTRLIFQFFVYSSKLWRGKKFETAVHIIFSILWTYLTITFLFVYLEVESLIP